MVVNLPSHQCEAALFVPEVTHSQYHVSITGPVKQLLSLLEQQGSYAAVVLFVLYKDNVCSNLPASLLFCSLKSH